MYSVDIRVVTDRVESRNVAHTLDRILRRRT